MGDPRLVGAVADKLLKIPTRVRLKATAWALLKYLGLCQQGTNPLN
jgi:hypothetical protein